MPAPVHLKAALWYARTMGWPVAPACFIRPDGSCSCGNPECGSPGKHPISEAAPHGFKDASKDPETIQEWWGRFPQANILVPTGEQTTGIPMAMY